MIIRGNGLIALMIKKDWIESVIETPIKHIYSKNRRILGVGLAKHLILLIPKFLGADEARKIWCGKYLIILKKSFYFMHSRDK